MIIHDMDLTCLTALIKSNLLTDDELTLIKRRLIFLFEQEDEFEAYYDSLMPQDKFTLEFEGQLFPSIWPFRPYIWLEEDIHSELISYLILIEMPGIVVIAPYKMDLMEFNPIQNGVLRDDVIRLADARNAEK